VDKDSTKFGIITIQEPINIDEFLKESTFVISKLDLDYENSKYEKMCRICL